MTNLKNHTFTDKNDQLVFAYKYMPGVHVTYLAANDMFKIDYLSNADYASTDLVKDEAAVIGAIMLKIYVIFAKYPKMASIDNLQRYIKALHQYVLTVTAPAKPELSYDEPVSEVPTKAFDMPTPNWVNGD